MSTNDEVNETENLEKNQEYQQMIPPNQIPLQPPPFGPMYPIPMGYPPLAFPVILHSSLQIFFIPQMLFTLPFLLIFDSNFVPILIQMMQTQSMNTNIIYNRRHILFLLHRWHTLKILHHHAVKFSVVLEESV
jgi:hypothetical protein